MEEILAELREVLEQYRLADSHRETGDTESSLQRGQNWPSRLRWLEFAFDRSPAVVFVWRVADGWPVEFVSQSVLEQLG